MRERVDALVEADARSIWVATFHGFCARLLSMEIEDAFHFRFSEFVKFETVGDVCGYLESRI